MSTITYKALLVGNSKYDEDPNDLNALKGPPNDVRALEEILTHPQVGLHNPENVQSLLECSSQEIMKSLDGFFHKATSNDQLIFYYSGHGRLDTYSNLYLCARDTDTNNLLSTSVPDVLISSMIKNSYSKRIIVILDCCHSGKFKGGSEIPQNLLGEGRFIISSSRSKELSKDAEKEDDRSPFTDFFIKALLSSEVDTNRDNYISLNEVYNHILPQLQLKSKQNPQRNFDGAVGELAVGKSNILIDEPPQPKTPSSYPPLLRVSTNSIEIKDVAMGEKLPEEIIDVYSPGGGILDWTLECSDSWIELEKSKGFFKMKLNPQPGTNRGRILVRDRQGAGSQRIQVMVKMLEAIEPPKLELSDNEVYFGKVILNATPSMETIRIRNVGGGDLNSKVKSLSDNFEVRLLGDIIEITPKVNVAGKIQGEILISSNGGESIVKAYAEVEKGAILRVSPTRVDFKTIEPGASKSIDVRISNAGGLKLNWKFEKQGDFFKITKKGEQLTLSFNAAPGSYHGAVIIKSNGGDKTIDVKGKVKTKSLPVPEKPKSQLDISGVWSVMGMAYLVFSRSGSGYNYQDCNMMGIVCGEGTASVQNNMVTLSGYSISAGQVYGQFTVTGNNMNGYLSTMGQKQQFSLTKQTGSIPNFLNFLNF